MRQIAGPTDTATATATATFVDDGMGISTDREGQRGQPPDPTLERGPGLRGCKDGVEYGLNCAVTPRLASHCIFNPPLFPFDVRTLA